ncbi:winged helix-turn-helix transcriptional regulator [Dorea sp.]
MNNMTEQIENLLKESGPLTQKQIAEALNITAGSCVIGVKKLIEEGKVTQVSSHSKRMYYFINKEATYKDVSNMHNEIAKETVNAKDTYEDLKEKYDEVNKNVNGLYANIISIIAVFVAIFALITVNANITFNLTTQNMCDVFWGIVKINIFVVICIIAMLGATRIIIINPLIKEKKDKRG